MIKKIDRPNFKQKKKMKKFDRSIIFNCIKDFILLFHFKNSLIFQIPTF